MIICPWRVSCSMKAFNDVSICKGLLMRGKKYHAIDSLDGVPGPCKISIREVLWGQVLFNSQDCISADSGSGRPVCLNNKTVKRN